jgi:AraC-like DNA-binding protein
MPGRDPVTFASVCGMLEHLISERRAQQDLLESLEISVARDLPDVPAFAEQARRRAVSERTLRRRLAEFGVTYAAVVDGVRRERVERLLRTRATLHDIARQVGFADERVLRRAVHRWHGVSPGRLRC